MNSRDAEANNFEDNDGKPLNFMNNDGLWTKTVRASVLNTRAPAAGRGEGRGIVATLQAL